MPLARYQFTVVDDRGNIMPGAAVEVRREVTGAPLATLYSDREGTVVKGNPFNVGLDAFAFFFVAGGAFKVTATLGALAREWRYVPVGLLQEFDLDVFIGGGRKTVRVATTGNVTIATALNNGDTVDGVVLVTGDLVLVGFQTAKAQNGVYVVGPSPSRDASFDTWTEHVGAFIAVQEGTLYGNTMWVFNVPDGGTLGADDLPVTRINFDATGPQGPAGSPLPRVTEIVTSATPTPDADTTDQYIITALATAAAFGVPTGVPAQGQKLIIRVEDNGTARALSWAGGAGGYREGIDVTFPTTTTSGKTLYVGFIYNATDVRWDLVATTNI